MAMVDGAVKGGSDDMLVDTLPTTTAPQKRSYRIVRVHLGLVLMQLGYAGYQVLTRVALVSGVSQFLFSFYRSLIAFIFLAPFAYYFERNVLPKMTMAMFWSFNLLAFTGVLGNQQLFLTGLSLTTPLFTAVSQNMIPVMTFVLAALLGLEEVSIRRKDGIAKIVGTIVCIGGAVLMTLYKGAAIYQGTVAQPEAGFMQPFQHLGAYLHSDALYFKDGNWKLGALCLVLNCTSWAVYLILQAPVLRRYPAILTVAAYTQLFGCIQVTILWVLWEGKLHFADFQLTTTNQIISIFYAGIIASGANLVLQTWCVQKAGAFMVSLYNPVQMLMVACMSVLILGDPLYLGILWGGALIIGGFYVVIYGQRVERRRKRAAADTKILGPGITTVPPLNTDPHLKTPLLS